MIKDNDKVCVHCLREPKETKLILTDYDNLMHHIEQNNFGLLFFLISHALDNVKDSREKSLARTKLEEAVMWLNKANEQHNT